MQLEEWSEHVLSLAGERFERRLAQEVAGLEIRLRQEIRDGFTALRRELSELRAETLKWSCDRRASVVHVAGALALCQEHRRALH